MKQLLNRLDSGKVTLAEVPIPAASGSQIIVKTRASLISAGTERMLVGFGRSGWIVKARQQPDKVKQVFDKARTDGIGPTIEAVRAKLEQPTPLGYCHAGIVVDSGARALSAFSVGDHVVTNGPHAEYVRVPITLPARIPEGVSFETASFTPLAAVALQGIRLANPTLGETIVIYGLGLIGLLAVQLARANGCRVIGIDRDAARSALAREFGAETIAAGDDVADQVLARTGGIGADAVLLTLASKSDDPVHQAAQMSRTRGRIVLVGVTGLQLRRDDFFKKELSFAVSCSYGPGRYDPAYEDQAQDYPLAYVRWTEQRNFEAVLGLMADGRVRTDALVSHRFPIDRAVDAYDLITSDQPSLGVVLTYPESGNRDFTRGRTIERRKTPSSGAGSVGFIGAGNYASRVLLPAIRAAGLNVRTISSSGGTSAAIAAEQFDAERVTSETNAVLSDPAIDSVFIVTRHDSHASLARRALQAGKNVFVEKPLAITMSELDELEAVARDASSILTVGFNRRFAPLTREVSEMLGKRAGPLSVIATINAGAIPRDHWTQSIEMGGGRIVGEAVHWIDLSRALVGAPIISLQVTSAHDRSGAAIDDVSSISLSFADGSTAVIHYLATGSKAFPKERIEVFFDGKTVAIDNWRRLRRFGVPGPMLERARPMDKGQNDEIAAWKRGLASGTPPIPLDELFEVSRFAIKAAELARAGGGTAR
jgi:predicted dehydrogenase